MPSIKIVSDGDPFNTVITDANTGEVLHGVTSYTVKHGYMGDKDPDITAELKVIWPSLDLTVNNVAFTPDCERCREVFRTSKEHIDFLKFLSSTSFPVDQDTPNISAMAARLLDDLSEAAKRFAK